MISPENKADVAGLFCMLAEFANAEELLAAARRARGEGYRELDAYSPFAVQGLPEALGLRPTRLPFAVLAGGILGGCGAYFMMWYSSVIDYPINAGGKPFHSWPSFVPITFELTVLAASFAALLAMLWLNGLPLPHHPIFAAPGFERASQDRFFLSIDARDPLFHADKARAFLEELHPIAVSAVALEER